jgi:hypothetical protein
LSQSSAERIRLLSLVDIFEPLSELEIEQLDGQLPDQHLEKGEIFYGPVLGPPYAPRRAAAVPHDTLCCEEHISSLHRSMLRPLR